MKKINITKDNIFIAEIITEDFDLAKKMSDIQKTSYPFPEYQYEILEYTKPLPTIAELREKEYDILGITEKKMTVDLWERIVENRPEASEETQAKRVMVKQKFPKKV